MLVFVRASRYDAGTGQFTQQDPIGIAGGANVYGFVDGDPINYSDPFGLCSILKWKDCRAVSGSLSLGGGIGGKFKAGPVQGQAKALSLEAKGSVALGGDGVSAEGELSGKLYSISGRLGPVSGGRSSGCSVGTDAAGSCQTTVSGSVGASSTSGSVTASGSNTSIGVGANLLFVSAEIEVDVYQTTIMAAGAIASTVKTVWNAVVGKGPRLTVGNK